MLSFLLDLEFFFEVCIVEKPNIFIAYATDYRFLLYRKVDLAVGFVRRFTSLNLGQYTERLKLYLVDLVEVCSENNIIVFWMQKNIINFNCFELNLINYTVMFLVEVAKIPDGFAVVNNRVFADNNRISSSGEIHSIYGLSNNLVIFSDLIVIFEFDLAASP